MPYIPAITGGGTDLAVNRFSGVGGSTLNQTILSLYSVYKPNEYNKLLFRHKSSLGVRMMLESMGNSRATAAPTVGHYEAPWRQNLLSAGAVGGGGVGLPVTITLSATDMFNAQATVNGAARQASYPIVGDVYMFNNFTQGYVSAKNEAVTPHVLTVTPVDAAVNLLPNITVGQGYAWLYNTHGEGTGLPAGRTPRFVKYSNTFAIIKTAVSITGSELTNSQYFEVVDGDAGIFALAKKDFYTDHEMAFDNMLLFGQQNNNLRVFNTNLAHDVPITGTEGLIQFIINGGNIDNYTQGAYTISDFDDIGNYYEQERVSGSDILACQGHLLNVEIENALTSLLDGDIAAMLENSMGFSESLPNDSTDRTGDKSLHFGFRGIKKGGYNYLFAKIAAFNSRMGAGAAVYNFNRWQLLFPKGKTPHTETGEEYGIVGYEYKGKNGYSRQMQEGTFSGVGIDMKPSNGNDIMISGMVSEIAFHGTRANACTIQRPI
jgi:hypothetical protein